MRRPSTCAGSWRPAASRSTTSRPAGVTRTARDPGPTPTSARNSATSASTTPLSGRGVGLNTSSVGCQCDRPATRAAAGARAGAPAHPGGAGSGAPARAGARGGWGGRVKRVVHGLERHVAAAREAHQHLAVHRVGAGAADAVVRVVLQQLAPRRVELGAQVGAGADQ